MYVKIMRGTITESLLCSQHIPYLYFHQNPARQVIIILILQVGKWKFIGLGNLLKVTKLVSG